MDHEIVTFIICLVGLLAVLPIPFILAVAHERGLVTPQLKKWLATIGIGGAGLIAISFLAALIGEGENYTIRVWGWVGLGMVSFICLLLLVRMHLTMSQQP